MRCGGLVFSFELPVVGRGEGEAEEGRGGELEVPLEMTPREGGFPPISGVGEGAAEGDDGTGVGAAEEGERAGAGGEVFVGDGDLDGWAETVEGEGAGRGERVCGCGRGGMEGGAKGEGVGALVAREGGGDADAAGAEEGFEAGEGIGPAFGLGHLAVADPFPLVGEGGGGGGIEVNGDDGGVEGEGFGEGVKGAEELGGIGEGLGKVDEAVDFPSGLEVEAEVERGGGEVAGVEAGGEGVEEAVEEEDEGFGGVNGILEVEGLGEGFGWAVELEEAAGFSAEEVVPAAGGGAEALGELLARDAAVIAEGADGEEVEQGEEGGAAFEVGEELEREVFEVVGGDEAGAGVGVEDGEVGEIRGLGESMAGMGGGAREEAEGAESGGRGGGEIEEEGVGGGDFQVGGEGFGEGDEAGEEGGFDLRLAGEDAEVGAADEGAVEGPAVGDAGVAGGGIGGEEGDGGVLFFPDIVVAEDGAGCGAQGGIAVEGGEEGEIGDMECGEHGGVPGDQVAWRRRWEWAWRRGRISARGRSKSARVRALERVRRRLAQGTMGEGVRTMRRQWARPQSCLRRHQAGWGMVRRVAGGRPWTSRRMEGIFPSRTRRSAALSISGIWRQRTQRMREQAAGLWDAGSKVSPASRRMSWGRAAWLPSPARRPASQR
jgi:hypothetical protein